MKYQIDKKMKHQICIFIILLSIGGKAIAQQIDPALSATVATGDMIKADALNDISKNQNKIASWQAIIAAHTETIRKYEKDIHDYLTNVSGAVKNLFEIKEAAEITTEIIKISNNLLKSAKDNPQGLAVVAIVQKHVTKTYQDMIGTYTYISSLTLNDKVLLNAAERNKITWTVLYELKRMRSNLLLLKFQIENYTLADLPQILFPMEYFYFVDGKRIAQEIIRDFSKL